MKRSTSRVTGHDFCGKVRLVLPKTFYCVSGLETNVYLDNVILAVNPGNYVFRATCEKGILQSDRWTHVSPANDGGDCSFRLDVLDESNKVIARGGSVFRVAAADAGAGKAITLLCIGDSLTHASVYTGHLLDLFRRPGNPELTLVGTHHIPEGGSEANRHEGYGGWTARMFVTHYTGTARTGDYKGRGSPFLYADAKGKPKLDFARYCRETNGGRGPDFATIFLGINDVFAATDQNLQETVDTSLRFYDRLLKMIHGVRKDTKIGAVLIPPPTTSQDAFGANYGCSQTRWQYKRNQHRFVECLMKRYGGREKENIYLIPVYLNLDCAHNYPQVTVPWNARTSETGIRQSNAVHPADPGYRQIGDAIYAWMKSVL